MNGLHLRFKKMKVLLMNSIVVGADRYLILAVEIVNIECRRASRETTLGQYFWLEGRANHRVYCYFNWNSGYYSGHILQDNKLSFSFRLYFFCLTLFF